MSEPKQKRKRSIDIGAITPNKKEKNDKIVKLGEIGELGIVFKVILIPRRSSRIAEQKQIAIPIAITEIDITSNVGNVLTQNIIETVSEGTRQNTDFPCWELLNAIIVVGADYTRCSTIAQLITLVDGTPKIVFADETCKQAYYADLNKRTNKVIGDYLTVCGQTMPIGLSTRLNGGTNVQCCYVYGKTVPGGSEVDHLNSTLDKKEAKGDLYIKFTNDSFLAIDNKMSDKCTSSNYALWVTPRGGLINDAIWKEMCINSLQQTHASMSTTDRTALQDDLHDAQHIVWTNYIEGIAEYKVQLTRKLIQLLFCHNAQKIYPIYKFDGRQWIDYSEYNEDKIDFISSSFVITPSDPGREVAKIFYTLNVAFTDGRAPMKVECFLRFKFTNFKSDQIVGEVIAQLNMLPQFPGISCVSASSARAPSHKKGHKKGHTKKGGSLRRRKIRRSTKK